SKRTHLPSGLTPRSATSPLRRGSSVVRTGALLAFSFQTRIDWSPRPTETSSVFEAKCSAVTAPRCPSSIGQGCSRSPSSVRRRLYEWGQASVSRDCPSGGKGRGDDGPFGRAPQPPRGRGWGVDKPARQPGRPLGCSRHAQVLLAVVTGGHGTHRRREAQRVQ